MILIDFNLNGTRDKILMNEQYCQCGRNSMHKSSVTVMKMQWNLALSAGKFF